MDNNTADLIKVLFRCLEFMGPEIRRGPAHPDWVETVNAANKVLCQYPLTKDAKETLQGLVKLASFANK